jgi:hypothetical protein
MNVNSDFMRGFWLATGVLVAVYVVGVASGVLRRIV